MPAAASLPPDRIPGLLLSLGLPDDRSSRIALSALMGEALGLDGERLRQVRLAMARPARGGAADGSLAARLAARAIAAGLDPVGAAFERVLGLCSREGSERGDGSAADGSEGRDPGDGRESDGRRDDGRGGQEPGTGQGSAGSGQGRAGAPVALEVPPDRLVAELASVFPAFLSAALSDPDLAAMARPGPSGKGWLHVPFSLSIDGVAFRGFFRILYDRDARKAERLVADIRSGERRRILELEPGRGGPRIRYRCDDALERGRFLGESFPGAVSGGLDAEATVELDGYGGYDGSAE